MSNGQGWKEKLNAWWWACGVIFSLWAGSCSTYSNRKGWLCRVLWARQRAAYTVGATSFSHLSLALGVWTVYLHRSALCQMWPQSISASFETVEKYKKSKLHEWVWNTKHTSWCKNKGRHGTVGETVKSKLAGSDLSYPVSDHRLFY